MTAEEVFCDLYDKYGEEFNWSMVPFSKAKGPLVDELKRELGKSHFLYDKTIYAVENVILLMMFCMCATGKTIRMYIISSI